METVRSGPIEWAVAERPHMGQSESGDRYLALGTGDGGLVAVVDGLGHGAEAADAAKGAVRSLERHANEPILSLVKNCHRNLTGTRGAVVSLAVFSAREDTMTWLGVGNVEGLLLRANATANPRRELLLLRGGVVGVHLPALAAGMVTIAPGDMLIFATDGVQSDFVNETLPQRDSPQAMADYILARWGRQTDDSLVLVVRYLGQSA
jgi:negative regulator of sigma-B (phosphoserine phosphatase)